MSKLSLLEKYYMIWKNRQLEVESFILNLEAAIQELDERLSRLESEFEEIKNRIFVNAPVDDRESIWIKIRGYSIESKKSTLLNPSKNYLFQIVEVTDDFIRVDKLGRVKLTKDMFMSVYEMLKEKRDWIRIGASVKNTDPNTVEGYLKSRFFGGNMDGQMTAPWISALLVRSDVEILFNDKAVGQAIKFNHPL
jgi:hypothetical protein